jgi:hypothetical protein
LDYWYYGTTTSAVCYLESENQAEETLLLRNLETRTEHRTKLQLNKGKK